MPDCIGRCPTFANSWPYAFRDNPCYCDGLCPANPEFPEVSITFIASGSRPERPVDRAVDADIIAVLWACRSARDRLIVLLMARAGLRRAEVLGLRRSDVHLLLDSRVLGCEVTHLHVVRREDNPNGAVAKSRRQRIVPLDFVTVQALDTYEFERM